MLILDAQTQHGIIDGFSVNVAIVAYTEKETITGPELAALCELDHQLQKDRAELRKKSKNFKEFYQAMSDLLKNNKYKNNYQILLTSKSEEVNA